LGEAETIAIVVRRELRCFFATDDSEARRLAAGKGVPVVDTGN
jgi:predicted nucleic acid-binding protein